MTLLKNVLAKSAERLGIIAQLGKLQRSGSERAAILAYHRIAENGLPGLNALPLNTFYRQIRWLHDHVRVVPLREIVTDLREGRDLSGKVAITFDDGYVDFFRYAYPLLHAYNMPATVFVTVHFLDGQIPWYDKLRFMVFRTTFPEFDWQFNGKLESFSLESAAERERTYSVLKRRLGSVPYPVRVEKMIDLMRILKVENFQSLAGCTMNWQQLKLVQRSGIDIGAHTVSHPFLSELDTVSQREEIILCKTILEEHLTAPVQNFCYPTGKKNDYNQDVVELVKEAGYCSACSSEVGYVQHGDNPYALKRLYTTEPFLAKFAWRLPIERV